MALTKQEQSDLDSAGPSAPASAAPAATTAAPAPQTLPSHAGPPGLSPGAFIHKSVAPLVPLFTGAKRAAGTSVGKVFDVINRPGAASEAASLRGPGAGVHTFIHSETPEQYQADTAELARRSTEQHAFPNPFPFAQTSGFGPVTHPMMTKAEYDAMPGWWHQATEMATMMRYDPTTYIGGSGVLEHLGEAVTARSFPAFVRAVNAAQKTDNPALQAWGQKALQLQESSHAPVRLAGKALGKATEQAQASVKSAGHMAAQAYDWTHYKGDVQRALELRFPGRGAQIFRSLKLINQARRGKAQDLSNTLLSRFDNVTKGLTPNEEAALYDAIHTGKVGALPAAMQAKAEMFKNITDSLAHLAGTEELRTSLEKGFATVKSPAGAIFPKGAVETLFGQAYRQGGGFELPRYFERFEPTAEEARAMQGVGAYRGSYMVTKHFDNWKDELDGILKEDQNATAAMRKLENKHLHDIITAPRQEEARAYSTAEKEDRNLLRRGEGAQIIKNPVLQRKLIDARLRTGAQAIAAHDAEGEVEKLFGKGAWKNVPSEAKAFFQETWDDPNANKFWRGLRSTIDVPKVGLFALPFRHMANISSLLALADPTALPGTLGYYTYLMAVGSGSKKLENAARWIGTKSGVNTEGLAKWISPEEAATRRAGALGQAGRYGVTGTPSVDRRAAAGWLGRVPIIGDVYKASNHALWTFDDAAKAVRFNRLMKQYRGSGMDEARAAAEAANRVGAELVDYSENSPLTEAMRYVFPFATYRTKFPVAVAASLMKHPERTLAYGRAAPELVGDYQQAPLGPPDQYNPQGRPMAGKSYLPLAEAMRGMANPMEYVRSSLGYPEQIAGSLTFGKAMERLTGKTDPRLAYGLTYGKDPDIKYITNAFLGSFPGGELALSRAGFGEWLNQGDLSGVLGQQTGFGITSAPSQLQQNLQRVYDMSVAAEQAARKAGNPQQGDLLKQARDRFVQKYQFFVQP